MSQRAPNTRWSGEARGGALVVLGAAFVLLGAAGCRSSLGTTPGAPSVPLAERSWSKGEAPTRFVACRAEAAGVERRAFAWTPTAAAADGAAGAAGGGGEDLAKEAQNPIASLISLPLQNNTAFGLGPYDRTMNVLNVQPVVPIPLGKDWNLVTRTILPVIYQPYVNEPSGGEFGLGDLSPTLFFAPAKPGKLVWGAGPALAFPTATSDLLGTGKWSAGPSVVALTMPGPWVIGVLASNLWSYAGDDARPDVNLFLAQYFVNYNLPDQWYLTSSPIITANWNAASGEQWTVPFGLGVGKIFQVSAGQNVNANLSAYYHAVRPTGSAEWTLRFQWTFLFPQ